MITLSRILDAILQTDYFKQQRKERDVKDEMKFYGHIRRKTDFEIELLDGFFEEDEETIFIPEIWNWIKEHIRDQVEWLTSDMKTFLSEGLYFKMEDYVWNKIGDLMNDLEDVYEKRLDGEWQRLTPKQAKPKLSKGQVYIALLNKNGELTREPFPITKDTKAKVTYKFTTETYTDKWHQTTRKERVILIDYEVEKRSISLRPNEVKATVIKT